MAQTGPLTEETGKELLVELRKARERAEATEGQYAVLRRTIVDVAGDPTDLR